MACKIEITKASFILQWNHSYRIKVLHSVGCESFSYLCCSCHTRQGMSIAHRLAHGHYVRTKITPLQLKSPEMTSHTPKAGLHLVCDKQSASWAHISVGSSREMHIYIMHMWLRKNWNRNWVITHSATLAEYPWGKIICPPTLGNDSAKKAEIYGTNCKKPWKGNGMVIFVAKSKSWYSTWALFKYTLRPLLFTSSIRSFTVSAYAWPGFGWFSLYMPL